MRLFLALFFDKVSVLHLEEEMNRLKEHFPSFRFVSPKKIHLTLWFYGNEITTIQQQAIIDALARLTPCHFNKPILLEQLIYLPSDSQAKVLAIKAETPILAPLVSKLDERMKEIGFIRTQPFMPHVTLARSCAKLKVQAKLESIHSSKLSLQVSNIALVQSLLSPTETAYIVKWCK